jgi:hypothetical protein
VSEFKLGSDHNNVTIRNKFLGGEELRCSTTDQDLDDLFAAIDKEIQLDPDVALDLLDVLEDEEASGEAGLDEDLIKSSVYLPQDDYVMEVGWTQNFEKFRNLAKCCRNFVRRNSCTTY